MNEALDALEELVEHTGYDAKRPFVSSRAIETARTVLSLLKATSSRPPTLVVADLHIRHGIVIEWGLESGYYALAIDGEGRLTCQN